MHRLASYRLLVANFLLVWMCGIIISGVVFMHKEVTSNGEIVTHIHPYNLNEKKHHQHHSDAEIRFLDIVTSIGFPSYLKLLSYLNLSYLNLDMGTSIRYYKNVKSYVDAAHHLI